MPVVLSAHCRLTSWRVLALRLALVLASALALGMSVGEPPAAFAHAVPVTTSPTANAILGEGPRDIMIRFSERVEPRVSVLRLSMPVEAASMTAMRQSSLATHGSTARRFIR